VPKARSPFQAAIGKLILELDRQYMSQVMDDQPLDSFEEALDKAHALLGCGSPDEVKDVLGPLTLRRYFGEMWLGSYPKISEKVSDAQELLSS